MNYHNSSFKDLESVQGQRCAITSRLQHICGLCLPLIWFPELTYQQVICGDIARKAKAGSLAPYLLEELALKTTNAIQTYAVIPENVSDWNFQIFAETTEIAKLASDVARYIARDLWQVSCSALIFSKLEINASKTMIVLQHLCAQKLTSKEITNVPSHTH